MQSTHLLLASSFTAAAIVFACSHGSYDGSFVGDAGGAGSEAGTVVLTKTIGPSSREELHAPDGALVVLFSAGSFAAPTTVTITRIADRTLNDTSPPLVVPAYVISGTSEPLLPFQVAVTGSNGNPGDRVLTVARVNADGQLAPTQLVGVEPTGQNGSSATLWGVARNFGTFSLIYRQLDSAFYDVASTSCVAKCCNRTGFNGNGNVGAIGGSCFCSSPPALECLLQNCPSTLGAEIERCVENATTGQPPPSCKPSSCTPGGPCGGYPNTTCATNQTCCINQHAGQCSGQPMAGLSPPACQGIAIRCDLQTACASGTKCCVFDTEAYCASSCPNERTWCNSAADCAGGGACTPTTNCPHGTCGTPPGACTN